MKGFFGVSENEELLWCMGCLAASQLTKILVSLLLSYLDFLSLLLSDV